MDVAGRAGDLLDRLELLGLHRGVTEEHLCTITVSGPLCTCCSNLAAALSCLSACVSHVEDSAQLITAAQALKVAADSPHDAANGLLDTALANLAAAIDPTATAASQSSSRLEHLELITAHVQATRILAFKQQHHQQKQHSGQADAQLVEHLAEAVQKSLRLDTGGGVDEAVTAVVKSITKLLGVDVCQSALPILTEVTQQLQEKLSGLPDTFFQPLVDLTRLNEQQQQLSQEVNDAFRREYTIRRRMLIERLKVTLHSFLWAPRVVEAGTKAELEGLIAQCQQQLSEVPAASLADVSAVSAADVASVMRKATSGEGGSFEAAVKRIVIGKVPDRGGRPEGRSREAAMPEWTARTSDSGSSNAGRGGGGSREGRGGGRESGRGGRDDGGHRGRGGGGQRGRGGGRRGDRGRGGRQ